MDAGPIVDAVSFLRDVASGEHPQVGRRVAVYGGGNTAMDAARTARRLGAEETMIVYCRTRQQMPAHEDEAQDAEQEGVRINWLRTITAFEGEQLQVEVMELDDSGFPQPTGRFETLTADTVILALGQDTDTAFLRSVAGVQFESDRTVRVSSSLMTGCAGVFAGGDMVPAERTVTVGVGLTRRRPGGLPALRIRGRDPRGQRRCLRSVVGRCRPMSVPARASNGHSSRAAVPGRAGTVRWARHPPACPRAAGARPRR
jgi:NADPH-dependent glutamate synthase beta subunit-like oxidoreductase